MLDVVRKKRDSKGSCIQSVFELFGWDFSSSKVLKKKLEEDKLLIQGQALVPNVFFKGYRKTRGYTLTYISFSSYKISLMKLQKKSFVFSIMDSRNKKMLKTTYVSAYEIWCKIDPKVQNFVQNLKIFENRIDYSFRKDTL